MWRKTFKFNKPSHTYDSRYLAPNNLTQAVTLLLTFERCSVRISAGFQQFPSVRPGEFRDSTSYQTTTTSIHIPPNSLFSILQSFDATPPESLMASWNKLRPPLSYGISVEGHSHYARMSCVSYVSPQALPHHRLLDDVVSTVLPPWL
jgi:hypothetical protein